MIRKDDVVIEIRTGWEPFAVCLLTACLVWSGVTLAALSEVSGATARAMPPWSIYVFFSGLFVCATATITGVVLEKFFARLYGFYIERAGLVGLCALCAVYAWWVGLISGSNGMSFILLMAAVSLGSAWRAALITLGLRRAKKVLP